MIFETKVQLSSPSPSQSNTSMLKSKSMPRYIALVITGMTCDKSADYLIPSGVGLTSNRDAYVLHPAPATRRSLLVADDWKQLSPSPQFSS